MIKLLVSIFHILSFFLINAQSSDIEIIKEHVKYVQENIDRFSVTSKITLEGSTDGGTIKKYHDKGELVKIQLEFLGETGKLIRELYIKKGSLLFAFDQEYNYNMPYYITTKEARKMGFDEGYNPEKTTKSEHRYYFFDDKMIRWINPKGKEETIDNQEWPAKQDLFLKELESFR